MKVGEDEYRCIYVVCVEMHSDVWDVWDILQYAAMGGDAWG